MGTAGDDVIVGSDQGDFVYSGAGNDRVCSLGGDDSVELYNEAHAWVDGGTGNDYLTGSSAGGTGPTNTITIYGGPGNDVIFGDLGNDWLYGGAGDDHLGGSWGSDFCSGGPGHDRFDQCETTPGRGHGHRTPPTSV